jgi:hypothetical protein
MNSAKVLILFVFLWLFVYALVFVIFLNSTSSNNIVISTSPDIPFVRNVVKSKSSPIRLKQYNESTKLDYEIEEFTNPFTSLRCIDSYDLDSTLPTDLIRVAVIITVRNEKKEFLLATVSTST